MIPWTGPASTSAPACGLRPGHAPRALRYPENSLLLVGGIPGAGKSTLLNRLFALDGTEEYPVRTPGGARVIDSQQSRNRLTRPLRALPYPLWRWAMHLVHYLRVLRMLRTGRDPVVAHVTATRRSALRLLGWYARRGGRQVHLLLIDAAPQEALRGQIERGRRIAFGSHRRHVRRWRRVLAGCAAGAGAVVPGARSLLLLERPAVADLAGIRFTPGAQDPPSGGAAPSAMP